MMVTNMKKCTECKWFRNSHYGELTIPSLLSHGDHRCEHPKVKPFEKAYTDKITGEKFPKRLAYCEMQRNYVFWLEAILMSKCGSRGRYWEPKANDE